MGGTRRTLAIDAGIAALLGAATAVTTIPAVDGDGGEAAMGPLGFAVVLATAMCLTFRRRFPIATVAAVVVGTALYTALGYPYGPIFVLVAVAVGTLAAFRDTRTTITVGVLLALGSVPYGVIADSDDDSPVVNVVIGVVWIALSVVAGMAVRQSRLARLRAKDADRRRVQSEERLAMAREVHDAVGHGLAVVNLHAGVALHVLDRDGVDVPDAVRESLEAIRRTGADALRDLRATLAPSASDDVTARGVADLPALVDAVTADGLHASLVVDGDATPLPSAVDAAVYRIAQEALTNVLKHARASTARVEIRHGAGEIAVVVTDNGGGGPIEPGRGLTGMRQRAESLGGTFDTTSTPTGVTVDARIPYATVTR